MLEQSAWAQGMGIGFHQVPWFVTDPLCWFFWGCFVLGVFVQFLILRRAQGWGKGTFPVLLVLGMLVCDVASHVITGWDLLLPLGIYWVLLLPMLVGALICSAAFAWVRRKQ